MSEVSVDIADFFALKGSANFNILTSRVTDDCNDPNILFTRKESSSHSERLFLFRENRWSPWREFISM